jgi:hypothetical protein
MGFSLRKDKVAERGETPGGRGGWYADPFGTAARRWYDQISGWTDRVQEPGEAPDKTGLARMDEAAVAAADATRSLDSDGEPMPLSRPVDPKYMANATNARLPAMDQHG